MNLRSCEVYRETQELFSQLQEILRRLPRGWAWWKDQAERAAGSVVLNTAEGWGRMSPGQKRTAFGTALAELHEVAAAVELGHRAGWVPGAAFEAFWTRADRISRMLGRLQR